MNFRFLFGAAAVSLLLGQSLAGVAGEVATTSLERTRMAAEQAEIERNHQAALGACHRNFAVSGCLAQAIQARRIRLEDLKQQRLRADAVQRKREGAESMRRIESKREHDIQLTLANTRKYEERQARAEHRLQQKEAKALRRSKPRSDPLPKD